jgi:hypothetical protein
MYEVDEGSVEGRILRILMELYPATWTDVQREMGVPPNSFNKAIAGLRRSGVVGVEGTTGERYLNLLRNDILFYKSGGRKRQKKPILPKQGYDGPMYG